MENNLKKEIPSIHQLFPYAGFVKIDQTDKHGKQFVLGFSENPGTFISSQGQKNNNGKSNNSRIFQKAHMYIKPLKTGLLIHDSNIANEGGLLNIYLAMPTLSEEGELDLKPIFEEDNTIANIEYLATYATTNDSGLIKYEHFYSVSHEYEDEEYICTHKYDEGVVIDMQGNIIRRLPKQYSELHFCEETGFIIGKTDDIDVISQNGIVQLEGLQEIYWKSKIINNNSGYAPNYVEVICEGKDKNNNTILFANSQTSGKIITMLDPQYSDIIDSVRKYFALGTTQRIGENKGKAFVLE